MYYDITIVNIKVII